MILPARVRLQQDDCRPVGVGDSGRVVARGLDASQARWMEGQDCEKRQPKWNTFRIQNNNKDKGKDNHSVSHCSSLARSWPEQS